MYILLRVEEGLFGKVLDFLRGLDIWFKEFNEPEYRIEVTAEERKKEIHIRHAKGYLNPGAAWKTCASFVRIWDHDSLGRGPWPKSEEEIERRGDSAPKGMGYLVDGDKRTRVAGQCGNPVQLNYISCPKWCTQYQPASIDAMVHVAETVAAEHKRRAELLLRQAEFLKATEMNYRQVIANGGVFEYRGGKFVISTKE
ncbi:MAG: hypothetical protein AAB513_01435 [Patescibacteria group bacterium]